MRNAGALKGAPAVLFQERADPQTVPAVLRAVNRSEMQHAELASETSNHCPWVAADHVDRPHQKRYLRATLQKPFEMPPPENT